MFKDTGKQFTYNFEIQTNGRTYKDSKLTVMGWTTDFCKYCKGNEITNLINYKYTDKSLLTLNTVLDTSLD